MFLRKRIFERVWFKDLENDLFGSLLSMKLKAVIAIMCIYNPSHPDPGQREN